MERKDLCEDARNRDLWWKRIILEWNSFCFELKLSLKGSNLLQVTKEKLWKRRERALFMKYCAKEFMSQIKMSVQHKFSHFVNSFNVWPFKILIPRKWGDVMNDLHCTTYFHSLWICTPLYYYNVNINISIQ